MLIIMLSEAKINYKEKYCPFYKTFSVTTKGVKSNFKNVLDSKISHKTQTLILLILVVLLILLLTLLLILLIMLS